MTTFVLVHGAWGGSYGFRYVRRQLQEQGHDVFTPSLTGIGERSHLTGPMVDVNLHIRDVTNTIFYEDLHDIVLLGFSYGGMVVTGALDLLGDRVRQLIYLDALVPANGQSAHDLIPMPLPPEEPGEPWSLAPLPRELDSPEATSWSNARRVDQPIRTFTEPISLRTPLEDRGLPLAFIKASADPAESPESAFWKAARHAQASDAWEYREVATNHMVPSMRPAELTALLLQLSE